MRAHETRPTKSDSLNPHNPSPLTISKLGASFPNQTEPQLLCRKHANGSPGPPAKFSLSGPQGPWGVDPFPRLPWQALILAHSGGLLVPLASPSCSPGPARLCCPQPGPASALTPGALRSYGHTAELSPNPTKEERTPRVLRGRELTGSRAMLVGTRGLELEEAALKILLRTQ